jgi:antitoxin component of MazEF toxin-antitoxin module
LSGAIFQGIPLSFFHFHQTVVQYHDIVPPEGAKMIKTLTKHGNSYALVIDKPILDLLKIRPDTPLAISTDGKNLLISPKEGERSGVSEEFEQSLEKVNRRFANVLRRLA